MIKTLLVPATGGSTDDVVFASALAVARAFDAHLNFLHVRVDAAAMAATMAQDGGGAAMITGLVDRIDEEASQREERGASDDESTRLVTALRWHGLNASTRHLQPGPAGAADTLLAAAGAESGLVVMGAYGHSRMREWIFGGFTQRVLRGAEVPVVMMH